MTVQMFPKKSDRVRTLAIGAAIAVAGGLFFHFAARSAPLGLAIAAAGVVVIALGVRRGRRPLITLDSHTLLLGFAAPLSVPLRTIVRLDQLKTHDIELGLTSGAKVLIPMSRLEDEEGRWLKKSLRNTLRDAKVPRTF
jgi:hypothetical protein